MLSSFATSNVALIQGASRGIGLQLVRLLLEESSFAHVIATSRTPQSSPGLTELKAQFPDRLTCVAMDITDETSVIAAAARIAGVHPQIHLLMNVSGILHDPTTGMAPEKRLQDLNVANAMRSFAVNALGPVLVVRHFADLLKHRDRSVVANISARVGSIGDNTLGGWYSYRASKAAQNQFTRTMAIELRRRGPLNICIALHPGTVDTELSSPFSASVPADKLFSPERAARQLLDVVDGLQPDQTGGYFAWDGTPIPW
jgi:NAD(P)-dependent dehydrogenase (short-subunit alcohol dehydrogenase family)